MSTVADSNPDKLEWDAFVKNHPSGYFTHLYGWSEALARTYDLPLFRVALRQKEPPGKITGLLPLILFSAPNRPRRLISLPYSDAGGILANTPADSARLLAAARELATNCEASHLEFRHTSATHSHLGNIFSKQPDCRAHSFKVGLTRPLPEDPDEMWRSLSAKVRNQVRKARKTGCHAVLGGEELLADFYAVFSENMRDLGSPVHSKSLFSEVFAQLDEGLCHVAIIRYREMPVAASLVIRSGSTLFNPWASSLRRFRPKCPNMLLYWSMLQHGCTCGCTTFDFGRSSPEAATCKFKLQWDAEPRPLTWHVISRPNAVWEPKSERLEYEEIRATTVAEALATGPKLRRWISL